MTSPNWSSVHFQGVMVNKPPYALFVYAREFLDRGTRLVMEAGTQTGGSALWFVVACGCDVITYDVSDEAWKLGENHPHIERRGDSLRSSLEPHPYWPDGPVSVSLDSNHEADHILAEMERFKMRVDVGQLLVVEDVDADPKTRGRIEEWEPQNKNFKLLNVPETPTFKWYERVK